ncbi:MAG TPA: class III extradiol ring-cleavage dioxygenase [Pseudomonas sp.]|nr:class III extradiol ring-cleavage dioxygenase [Pseudomonas sp.]
MLPSLFISHGSPMVALEPDGDTGRTLARLGRELPRPRAILLVSAHWETDDLRLTAAPQQQAWHDFYGFPPALYALEYAPPGEPQLAQEIAELLLAAGLPAHLDPQRPLDHGAWVPLRFMYPSADIPVVQLSLPSRQGPALQTRLGQALAGLREHGILLIGSGSVTHNLRELDWDAGPEVVQPWAREFRDWLVAHLESGDQTALHDYRQQAPWAVRSHPSDEHLLPLFFARGAGGAFHVEYQGFTKGTISRDIYRFG